MEAVDSNRHEKAGEVIESWALHAGFPSLINLSVQMTELMVFGSRRFGMVLRILMTRPPFVERRNGQM